MILSLVRPFGGPTTRASPSPQDYLGNRDGLTEEVITIARRGVWEGSAEAPVRSRDSGMPDPAPLPPPDFTPLILQLQSGIGRLILKEEMKARSSSYADPWTPPRSSTSSREALHTTGYEMSFNGCKHCSVLAVLAAGSVPAPHPPHPPP